MPESLRNAVADAIARAETCSVDAGRTLGRVSAYADLTAARDAGQIVPGRSQSECLDDDGTVAFVDAIPGSTIYICPLFFTQSATGMSLTIMHEGLHLSGVHHSDFPGGSADNRGPMDNAIRSACGY